MKAKRMFRIKFLLATFMLLGVFSLSAQILVNIPEPADNPNLAGNSPWTAICAGVGGFNEYYINISWAGTANGANEFILELSDANGDFTNAVELLRVSDQNTNSSKEFNTAFSIPTDTRGQGYTMRVRSTDPANTSDPSPAYHMYYMDVTTNINISADGSGVPPGMVCATGPITLQVDNVPNPETYQYIWYMSGTPLSGETGHTLNVTASGMYYAIIDYGSICSGSGNTDSNIVDVTIGSGGQGIFINPPTKSVLCAGETETLSINTTDASWAYMWFKDGVQISGATSSTYTVDASNADFEGDYQVEISSNAICNERSVPITMSNADDFTVTMDNAANIVLLPTQTETLSVATTAISPSYKWYRNGLELSGETSATVNVAQEGTYYVEVTQGGGTCPGTLKNSENTMVVVPDSFEIVTDYAAAYTACASTDVVLQVQTIHAVLTDLSKIDVTADIASDFTYQWKLNGTDVSAATGSSLSLTDIAENGNYTLEGTISSYSTTSNSLSVQLLTNETLSIASTGTVYCSPSDSVTLSTTTDLTGESYEWQRDGVAVNTTDTAFDIDAVGTYRLVLEKNGCSLISNEVTIQTLDASLITLDPSGDVVLPEGSSRTITANGGTAYRWYDANNVEVSASASLSVTEEGTYTLIASIDNCELTRQINVTYLDTFKIPNVISVNGDGINDQWVIPNSYSNKTDVNVIIYNEKGEEILNEFEYKNTWPSSSMAFPKQNMVFYYKIRNAQEVLKQGTITVIR
ncbi:MAG: gliding motility-associated C-terminal domain-containing protein [Maribacter sp.]|uniref:T9SS type B sorting domain-containing protein n=1 Tax=Maribacter sp. TaxID=1897614 RepID=UPI003C70A17D